jgi:WD40 repeat protein
LKDANANANANVDADDRYNTFASAGSDGTVSIWDHKVKKRLRQYPKFPTGMFYVLSSFFLSHLLLIHVH